MHLSSFLTSFWFFARLIVEEDGETSTRSTEKILFASRRWFLSLDLSGAMNREEMEHNPHQHRRAHYSWGLCSWKNNGRSHHYHRNISWRKSYSPRLMLRKIDPPKVIMSIVARFKRKRIFTSIETSILALTIKPSSMMTIPLPPPLISAVEAIADGTST